MSANEPALPEWWISLGPICSASLAFGGWLMSEGELQEFCRYCKNTFLMCSFSGPTSFFFSIIVIVYTHQMPRPLSPENMGLVTELWCVPFLQVCVSHQPYQHKM